MGSKMGSKVFPLIIILKTFVFHSNILYAETDKKFSRPEKWAVPIEMKGVPNLDKVSDQLYRSAQPTAEGMKNLKQLGIKTIVNLRSFHSDKDEIEKSGSDFICEHIYMKAWHPEKEDVIKFLKIVSDPQKTPVLVHCQQGADRTGTMCAIYRIVIQGWNKEDAIEEMTEGGYNFHEIWKDLKTFINKLNPEDLKKEAGVK